MDVQYWVFFIMYLVSIIDYIIFLYVLKNIYLLFWQKWFFFSRKSIEDYDPVLNIGIKSDEITT